MSQRGVYRAVILDLDGCVYVGSRLIAGAAEAIASLRGMGLKVLFLTNNSTVSRGMVASKLSRLGVECGVGEVITSGAAASIYLRRRRGSSRVLLVGERGLFEEAEAEGHVPVGWEEAEAVIVGLDRNVAYSRLKEAHRAVLRGAFFLATNRDHVLPTESGTIPGAGAIVAFLETSTGVRAVAVGKPERFIMELALERLGASPEEVVMIGDRLDTDIAAAERVGVKGILVMTGIEKKEIPRGVEAVESISELPHLLSKR